MDLRRVKQSRGDYGERELSEAVKDHLDYIATTSADLIGSRQTVVFACDIAHMHTLKRAYERLGVKTGEVWGAMPRDMRETVLSEWRDEQLQVVVNVGVLTEGFDYPGITAVIMARPTMSPGLYVQMMGRGLRRFPGKENCLIVDYTGTPTPSEYGFETGYNVTQVTMPDVLGERDPVAEENTGQRDEKKLRSLKGWSPHGYARVIEIETYVISGGTNRPLYAIVTDPISGLNRLAKIDSRTKTMTLLEKDGAPYEPMIMRYAVSVMDEYLARVGVNKALAGHGAPWRRNQPSQPQLKYLSSLDRDSYESARYYKWDAGKVGDEITRNISRRAVRKYWRQNLSKSA